ncbi:MAG: o-succinylbenzoate synthase, partial [Paenisporosarcina sp.]
HVRVPLKRPFSTHLQTVKERESILIEMTDVNGIVGVGECVAFTSPWYTEETVSTAWHVLEQWLMPLVLHQTFTHPNELDVAMLSIKGNRMAKAALNHAIWDIYSKKMNQPLWKLIGGIRQNIEAGVVISENNFTALLKAVEKAEVDGYKRVKVKISTTSNPTELKEIISRFPNLQFFADANAAFSKDSIHILQQFDEIGLTLIEQPFSEEENLLSAKVQAKMKIPFALDESISSFSDTIQMNKEQSGKIIVLKQGRVGGLSEALKIHDFAMEKDIPLWVGGMIEFGVSKAFNAAFASLPSVQYPGDFSSSDYFFEQDLTLPPIHVHNGILTLSNEAGVGVKLNHSLIERFLVKSVKVK